MPNTNVNIATFGTGAARFAIGELEGDYTRTAGMRPEVNRFRVSCTEFDKIRDSLYEVGSLFLSWTAEGATDVTIAGVRVVDWRPGRVGTLRGESSSRVIEYTLFLADARADLVAPYGGRVNEGLVNPDANDDGLPDVAPIAMSDLITICCRAMGFTPASMPPGANAAAPPLNLRWFGVPAEAELAKLLEASGSLMAPSLTGDVGFHTSGEGNPPSFSGAVSDVLDPAPKGRGDMLIISSAPSAAIDTLKVTGTDLQFVMPDVDGVWRLIDAPEITANYWAGSTAVEQLKKKFKDATDGHKRETAQRYAYRCIRLDPAKYDPTLQRMLRRVVTPVTDKTTVKLKGLIVRAKRAVKKSEGTWVNSTELQRCNAEYLLGPNVIILSDLLGKLATSPGASLEKDFVALSGSEIEVEFSVEGVVTSPSTNRKVPEYTYFAYRRRAAGGFDALSIEESEVFARTPEKGTIFASVPSLRRVRDARSSSETADNLEQLQTAADALASQYFAGAAQRTRTVVLRGYHPVELDGRVHEVCYSQESLTTTIVIDKLDPASKTRFLSNLARAQLGGLGAGGTAGQSPADSLALGSVGGGAQPVVPLGPAAKADVPLQVIPMRTSSVPPTKETGKQRYVYVLREQRKATPGSSGATWEDMPGGRTGVGYHFLEANNDSSGLLGNGITVNANGEIPGTKIKFQPVPGGTFVVAIEVPVVSTGQTEIWFFCAGNGMDGSCS